MSSEGRELSILEVSFRNGKKLEVNICNCGECDNQFFVPAPVGSMDWKPSFCPYCGIKFIEYGIDEIKL